MLQKIQNYATVQCEKAEMENLTLYR